MAAPAVPSQYQSIIAADAQATGLPVSVVASQVGAESSFNANAVSSKGALGFYQFEPTTYNAIAPNVGVPVNSETNVADASKVYVSYMNQLLAQEGGSVFKALEAYNAGPANLSAGSAYATSILKQAGQTNNLQASASATTAGFNISQLLPFLNPVGTAEQGLGGILGSSGSGTVEDLLNDVLNGLFKALGVTGLKDMLQRLGIILFGGILVIVGIVNCQRGALTSSLLPRPNHRTRRQARLDRALPIVLPVIPRLPAILPGLLRNQRKQRRQVRISRVVR